MYFTRRDEDIKAVNTRENERSMRKTWNLKKSTSTNSWNYASNSTEGSP